MLFALCSKNATKASSTFDLLGLAAFWLRESGARKVSKFRVKCTFVDLRFYDFL